MGDFKLNQFDDQNIDEDLNYLSENEISCQVHENEKDSLNYAISSSISIASKVNKCNKAVQKTLINVVKNNIKALGWHLGVEDENDILSEFNFIDVPKAMERVSIKDNQRSILSKSKRSNVESVPPSKSASSWYSSSSSGNNTPKNHQPFIFSNYAKTGHSNRTLEENKMLFSRRTPNVFETIQFGGCDTIAEIDEEDKRRDNTITHERTDGMIKTTLIVDDDLNIYEEDNE